MKAGNYTGTIDEHGTDTSSSGLPFIWFDVEIVDESGFGVVGRCKAFLGGRDEDKTKTAIRMARATLRLCGFDPDTQDVTALDENPHLLKGNKIPVRVSQKEYQGKFYDNYDIALPRGVDKKQASALTSALRAAKSKDETPMSAPAKAPAPPAGGNRVVKATDPLGGTFDDGIPFGILLPVLIAMGLA